MRQSKPSRWRERLAGVLLIATTNPHKVTEIARVLELPEVRIRLLSEFPPEPAPAEDGESFVDNARLKADWYRTRYDMPCLADDSGLVVDFLGGLPGVHSARFMEGAPYAARNQHIVEQLRGVAMPQRTARYTCSLVVSFPDGERLETTVSCEGFIADTPRGDNGFGYDPIFLVPSHGRTFGGLPAEVKDRISHRALALGALKGRLEEVAPGD